MPADGLDRFLDAQRPVLADALSELAEGRKRRHWIWFVFPQLRGLGRSDRAQYYGLDGADEARAYAGHPILAPRLRGCGELALSHAGLAADEVMGSGIDAAKLRSCATLFATVAPGQPVFPALLDAFFGGARCPRTDEMLEAG